MLFRILSLALTGVLLAGAARAVDGQRVSHRQYRRRARAARVTTY